MNNTGNSIVTATASGRVFLLKLEKNDSDIAFIRTLGRVRWDSTAFCWVIPNNGEHIAEKVTTYFGTRLQWVETKKKIVIPRISDESAEERTLTVYKIRNGRLKLIFPYSPPMFQVIKQHPFYGWNAKEKYWTLPGTENTINTLRGFCEEVKWKFVIREGEINQPRMPRQEGAKTRVRLECPIEYLDKLRMMRYSEKTISVYRSCFTEFINYYSGKKIEEITYDEICDYQLYLVESRRVSISYQNQAINSIKFFFEKILKGQRETYYIERPRQEKRLPTVLSIEEVKAIINSIENLKHKCAIMTTYSAGLRTGELLNLKVGDIDSKRMLIIVRQGKGKKDRITLLSPTLLEILRIYFKQYHPKDYLFEGEDGDRYAERSVQNILARAVEKTRITKHVTMHTLRHSFATHMLEQNTDIRYIKELLGHSNLKTTLIYTHVTTKGLDKLRSPLDNLGL